MIGLEFFGLPTHHSYPSDADSSCGEVDRAESCLLSISNASSNDDGVNHSAACSSEHDSIAESCRHFRSNLSLSLPVHLRYQPPSDHATDGSVRIDAPQVFVRRHLLESPLRGGQAGRYQRCFDWTHLGLPGNSHTPQCAPLQGAIADNLGGVYQPATAITVDSIVCSSEHRHGCDGAGSHVLLSMPLGDSSALGGVLLVTFCVMACSTAVLLLALCRKVRLR